MPCPLEVAIQWWGLVEDWEIQITWFVDPDTSISGASSYTRTFVMTRQLHATLKERMLVYPGLYRDEVLGESGPFNTAPLSCFHWTGGPGLVGEDDVFSSTILGGQLRLFWDGYKIPELTPGLPPGFIQPSIQLRVTMVYDDGTEGSLHIDSFPARWEDEDPDPDFVPPTIITNTATIDGVQFVIRASDDVEALTYFQGEPDVVITPKKFYEWRKRDGTTPMWDSVTGALMPGRNPLENAL